MAVKEKTRVDIERQRVQDARRAMSEQLLKVRYHAVLEAYDEVIANAEDPDAPPNQEGAVWALRQGLVDLASCCEELIDEMPVPRERD